MRGRGCSKSEQLQPLMCALNQHHGASAKHMWPAPPAGRYTPFTTLADRRRGPKQHKSPVAIVELNDGIVCLHRLWDQQAAGSRRLATNWRLHQAVPVVHWPVQRFEMDSGSFFDDERVKRRLALHAFQNMGPVNGHLLVGFVTREQVTGIPGPDQGRQQDRDRSPLAPLNAAMPMLSIKCTTRWLLRQRYSACFPWLALSTDLWNVVREQEVGESSFEEIENEMRCRRNAWK